MHSSFFRLDADEFNRFIDFLKSPFFNTNEQLVKLAEILYETGYNNYVKRGAKDRIKPRFAKGKTIPDSTLRKHISALNSLFERFLSETELEHDLTCHEIYLNQSLIKRDEFKSVKKISEKKIKKLSSSFLKDDMNYLHAAWFYDDIYTTEAVLEPQSPPVALKLKSRNLDMFYIFSKLHTFLAYQVHKFSFKLSNTYEDEMIDSILEYIEKNSEEIKNSHPNIYITYLQALFYENNLDKKYTELYEEYLNKIRDKLDKERQYYYTIYLSSMLQLLQDKGDESAWEKSFRNHKILVDSANLTPDNYLLSSVFLRIVFDALHLREFKWLRNFLGKHTELLRPEERNDYVNLAYARLCLYESKYDEAIKHLNSVKASSPVMYFNVKVVLCFVYFENKEELLLESLLDSLRNYKKRNKHASENLVKNVSLFLEFFRRLIGCRDDKYELNKLLKEIQSGNKRVPAKNMFIDKITSMLSSK